MKCTFCDSEIEMDPPKLMVTIHDLENGTGIGYYDKHECALADSKATLEYMRDNSKLDGAPGAFSREAVFLEKAPEFEPGTVIDVGIEVTTPQPRYNIKGYRRAVAASQQVTDAITREAEDRWNHNDQTWTLVPTEGELWELESGFKVPYIKRVFTLEGTDFVAVIEHDDTFVWIKFPGLSDEFTLKLDPERYSRSNHNSWITQQIEVLASNASALTTATSDEAVTTVPRATSATGTAAPDVEELATTTAADPFG